LVRFRLLLRNMPDIIRPRFGRSSGINRA